ncbi:SDR family oxidoreductase [Hymenobacter sp.]|uniref:SDR family oxidoreductase n=1 Tax=Hymenobacter sp. TaxID=1898978 RepID=UPI00286BA1E2|nr:SDR family oxidoreductase [Hymenobacter sp.]
MSEFANKVLVVAGGTGGIGEEIVKTLLLAGATVVVPSRGAEHLTRLQDYCAGAPGRLLPVVADVSTLAGAETLRDQVLTQAGGLDGIVAALNGRQLYQPLLTLSENDWLDVVNNYLTAHFMTAKVLLPELLARDAGHYVMINGGAAEHVYPGLTYMSMMAAAQLMMTKGLLAEHAKSAVSIHSLLIHSRVATRHEAATQAGQVTSAQVAGKVAELLAAQHKDQTPAIQALHMATVVQ